MKYDLVCCVEEGSAQLPPQLKDAMRAANVALLPSAVEPASSDSSALDNQPWRLDYSSRGLAVSHTEKTELQNIRVDFNTELARFANRRKVAHELLIKAVGGVAPPGRRIIDATAGLGVDSLLLAKAGHKVHMLERSAIVGLLLQDALLRAPELGEKLSLQSGDAAHVLEDLSEADKPDLVYLDPMFPPTGKSAKARKGLQALKELLPEAVSEPGKDEATLLQVALSAARYRVVVKRPLRAKPLPGPAPGFNYSGKLVRYDCYSLRKLSA